MISDINEICVTVLDEMITHVEVESAIAHDHNYALPKNDFLNENTFAFNNPTEHIDLNLHYSPSPVDKIVDNSIQLDKFQNLFNNMIKQDVNGKMMDDLVQMSESTMKSVLVLNKKVDKLEQICQENLNQTRQLQQIMEMSFNKNIKNHERRSFDKLKYIDEYAEIENETAKCSFSEENFNSKRRRDWEENDENDENILPPTKSKPVGLSKQRRANREQGKVKFIY